MARTPSTQLLQLGAQAPDFVLPNTDATLTRRDDFLGKPLLVMFICNHCPYVKHVRDELARLGRDYADKAFVVGINSNDIVNYPDDSPELMRQEAQEAGYVFPYLFDETQEVAKAYGAACTPDFFLFDKSHKLVYRGQLDDSRPQNAIAVTGASLRAALDATLAGNAVDPDQRTSLGCNIKWKPNNAPSYFG